MATIKRISPLSAAKISGLMYAIMGFIFGAMFSVFSSMVPKTASQNGAPVPPFFGPAAIILFPIFYGLIGFVFTWIGAWLYNLLAGWVGGFQIELDAPHPDTVMTGHSPTVL